MQVFTIGYEGVTQDALVASLVGAGVEAVADVRALPLSRRPGFSKTSLAAALAAAGIDYLPMRSLGTPAEGRAAARRHDHATLARVYADQLDLPEAIVAAARLREAVAARPTALLCFEREPVGCHRSLLVAAVLPDAAVVDLYP